MKDDPTGNRRAFDFEPSDPNLALEDELKAGLTLYWQTAAKVLEGSGIRLNYPDSHCFTLERNFFTALFLYSYYRCRIPPDRRIFYTAVNQCLRGMVTGCDNLLDREYKMTLDTDLPPSAIRFRSVIDIMVSDRVLFEILLDHCSKKQISAGLVIESSKASLKALMRSGTQEASEEAGTAVKRLPPDRVISEIHHFKTGILFQCPWAVPAVLEPKLQPEVSGVKDALYRIGIGCQLLDDMVDLSLDLRNQRQNYVASMVVFGNNGQAKNCLEKAASMESPAAYFSQFPELTRKVYNTADDYLINGLSRLFIKDHLFMVDFAADFIARRIGVDRIANRISGR